MSTLDPGATVLVTGGNGFIAAHVITTLLRHDYNVRATVRSMEKAEIVRKSFVAAGVQNMEQLKFVVATDEDLTVDFYTSLMAGCQAVLHLASSFSYEAKPGQFEEKLMAPAVKMTDVICRAASNAQSVRRVVVMSSFASVYDASLGLQPGRVYTEKDWCPLSYEDGVNAEAAPIAYRASKVAAERAAWDFVREKRPHYELVTLCPGMVFGKMIHGINSLSDLNASNQIVWSVLKAGSDGEVPPTKAPVWVDVEDLAEATLRAATYENAGNRRFLVTHGSYDTQEIADIVRAALPEKSRAPLGEPGKRFAHEHYSCDSSTAQDVLGMMFKSLRESIVPLAEQLYEMEKKEKESERKT
ncbi:hypothetical protein N7532_000049 [Penicillium argentinense]|uniref:NAD-dependent epimerase/dehydratase domain-containing protein n=1 Tax=Penicillium argentinense TaxID=1131581 RepID=A0A9W9KM94_9EURO|nr:uncharacterized protein N7532_000049 [Penicillium argentinense]KAJ5112004.1 hypothetical protein N7532_000049 [Penicillium argentinense]